MQYYLNECVILCVLLCAWFNCYRWDFFLHRMFELGWWMWMSVAGLSLGCAFSVKWVGLFVIALVGLRTIRDLWDLLGDLRNTKVC